MCHELPFGVGHFLWNVILTDSRGFRQRACTDVGSYMYICIGTYLCIHVNACMDECTCAAILYPAV